jgi:hypothetical protein
MRSGQATLHRLVDWQDLKSLKSQAVVWQLDTQLLNALHRCQTSHPPLDRRHPTGPQVKLSPIVLGDQIKIYGSIMERLRTLRI